MKKKEHGQELSFITPEKYMDLIREISLLLDFSSSCLRESKEAMESRLESGYTHYEDKSKEAFSRFKSQLQEIRKRVTILTTSTLIY